VCRGLGWINIPSTPGTIRHERRRVRVDAEADLAPALSDEIGQPVGEGRAQV
jgi:hypothetical protein